MSKNFREGMKIDILMSTYNGEKYLKLQIDSILSQSYQNWRLLVRDDSSSDNTLSILESYMHKYPNQVFLVDRGTPNLGSSKSFARLLDFVEGDYFMISDQDDIWLPNKIEQTMIEMHKLELKYGNMPLMICCDAKCIDVNNDEICPSFYESQKFIDTTDKDLKLLALNVVQGSTSLMNKKVLDYVKPIPAYVLHDQWIAVITAHFGKVVYLHKQLLLYRQHDKNVLGALNVGLLYFVNKIRHFKKQLQIYESFYNSLPFKVNVGYWILLKVYYTMRRL